MSERKYRVAMMFAGDPSSRAMLKLEETRLGDIAKALRSKSCATALGGLLGGRCPSLAHYVRGPESTCRASAAGGG